LTREISLSRFHSTGRRSRISTGQYIIAQFLDNGTGGGPGGGEFRFVGATTPEPASVSLLLVGLVSLGFLARRFSRV
jgi:hypothetical protein